MARRTERPAKIVDLSIRLEFIGRVELNRLLEEIFKAKRAFYTSTELIFSRLWVSPKN